MSPISWVKPGCAALLLVSLSACAQSPVLPAAESLPLPVAQRELTSQVMYQVLLGEIASQRGELKLSAEAYTDLAQRTRDVGVAKRATEVAHFARLPAVALKNARLWQELDPTSPSALQKLSSLLIGAGLLTEAKPHVQAWLKTGKVEEKFMQLHGVLARQKDKQAVFEFVADVATEFAAVPEARFATAQAAWQAGNSLKALAELDEVMRLKPRWSAAPLFKAQVLHQADGEQAALSFFKDYLAAKPDERDMRLAYAKLLARSARFAESRSQFEWMAKEMPDNPENYLAIGLIAMQTKDLDSAETSMTKALNLGHPDEGSVRFHLGQVAEARGRNEQALTWYQSVTNGRQRFDAQLRAGIILSKLGRADQALAWLAKMEPGNDADRVELVQTKAQIMRDSKNHAGAFDLLTTALEAMPDAGDLLYDRAMAAEKLGRLDIVEIDLRRLIELKPDYAHAYNALGYTLADRTSRLQEAIELLEKALELAPDDPFILDSMGWALFKSKRYDEAIEYLRRALDAKPDPEIAAHLSEALWMRGEKLEAKRVLQGALQTFPDNEVLRESASRLLP
jgi:tetratricopeptide (TPR) repeat protein